MFPDPVEECHLSSDFCAFSVLSIRSEVLAYWIGSNVLCVEVERRDCSVCWNDACSHEVAYYRHDHRNVWNNPSFWILLPDVAYNVATGRIGRILALAFYLQVPIIGGCVDKIPFLKSFASSAAQQARKYPNV